MAPVRLASLVARGLLASVVAVLFTVASLLLVTALNANPDPRAHEHALLADRSVAVDPLPPEPETDAPSENASLLAPVPTPATAEQPEVTRPPVAPLQLAGVAPAAGPGSVGIGGGTAGLPSVAGLPGATLPTETTRATVTPARLTRRVAAEYPNLAQRRGIEGFVTVRLRIDATGKVSDAVVVASEPPGVFDRSALRTVRRYRFAPARRGDEAVASTLQQTIRFELSEP